MTGTSNVRRFVTNVAVNQTESAMGKIFMPTDKRQHIAARVAFFIAGFMVAAWGPMVPYARERAGLDDGQLGLLLLCLGAGSIVIMPFVAGLAARFGCRAVIVTGAVLMCFALPGLALGSSLPMLALSLAWLGGTLSTVDIAMNIQAVEIEKASDKPVMSGFHGLFSLGTVAGAGLVSLVLWQGGTPFVAALTVVAIVLALILPTAHGLITTGGERAARGFMMPRGIVLLLGLLCFISFLAEGAMLDWGAVFLIDHKNVDPSVAGVGYAVFASMITIGRLTGDRAVTAVGRPRVMALGAGLAAIGLLTLIHAPNFPVALIGFAVTGIGLANLVPVLFSTASRQHVMPENQALAGILAMGYTGLLAGPAALGFIAHHASLPLAFWAIIALLALVLACSRTVAR